MERLFAWVDSNPPSGDQRFSARRATKLFLAIIISSILGGLPLALFQLGLLSFKHAQEEDRRQEQFQKGLGELEKAAQEGNAGEATRRLFGVDAPHPNEPTPADQKQ